MLYWMGVAGALLVVNCPCLYTVVSSRELWDEPMAGGIGDCYRLVPEFPTAIDSSQSSGAGFVIVITALLITMDDLSPLRIQHGQ